jgi:hypothetical protein
VTMLDPTGRPAGRRALPVRWIACIAVLLLVAAMVGINAASAQQQPSGDNTATSVDDGQASDTSEDPAATDTTEDPAATDTSEDPAATDTSEDPAATDTTEAADDAQDPNGNINDLPVHDGVQRGAVFNPTPYGEIPGNTPQVLIQRPGSGRILPLNTEIRVRARFANFEPGFFADPATRYGLDSQRLNGEGNLQGHNHACIQRVNRRGEVPGERCDSFVVLEREGDSDIVAGIAPPLTAAGRYRICVDASGENHYEAARAFAQRGLPVDCVRVLVMNFGRRR